MCHNHDILRSNNTDLQQLVKLLSRRNFLTKTSMGLGAIALGSLLTSEKVFSSVNIGLDAEVLLNTYNKNRLGLPHHLPKAKRIVYLFQSGGPSQLDMFDYKPVLKDMFGKDLPESVRQGRRITRLSDVKTSFSMDPCILNITE